MKKTLSFILALLMVIAVTATVYADDNKAQQPTYATDYYMIVESPDGGVNIYATADPSGSPLNSNLIPNGYPFHILGEIQGSDGQTWGYVTYHGMNGYVPLENLRPATEEEAVNAYLALSDTADVDYDVITQGTDGRVYLYDGPGTIFDLHPGCTYVDNDQKLHVEEEAATEDGGHWGLTTVNDENCWINLDETDLQGEQYTTSTPGGNSSSDNNLLEMQGTDSGSEQNSDEESGDNSSLITAGSADAEASSTSEPTATNTPTPKPTATNTPTPKPTATNTPTPKPTATNTPTPEPTATNTPTPEPTATNTPTPEPTATDTPTPKPTATDTPTPEPTVTVAQETTKEAISSTTETTEVSSEESETTTAESSKSSASKYLWIIVVIAILGGAGAFFKFKK